MANEIVDAQFELLDPGDSVVFLKTMSQREKTFVEKFTQALDAAVERGEVRRFKAFRIKARLSTLPRFRREVMSACTAELALSDEGYRGFVDWENFDVEKFAEFLDVILNFIAKLMEMF